MNKHPDFSEELKADPDALDSPTLFPYKIMPKRRMAHVDLGFFEDLRREWNLGREDFIRIESVPKGIKLSPVKNQWVQEAGPRP